MDGGAWLGSECEVEDVGPCQDAGPCQEQGAGEKTSPLRERERTIAGGRLRSGRSKGVAREKPRPSRAPAKGAPARGGAVASRRPAHGRKVEERP